MYFLLYLHCNLSKLITKSYKFCKFQYLKTQINECNFLSLPASNYLIQKAEYFSNFSNSNKVLGFIGFQRLCILQKSCAILLQDFNIFHMVFLRLSQLKKK